MTEEEKKAAAEQKQREMEEMMRQAQESYRQEYASMPYDGPVYGCRREELMLPMQDGVKLYTEIFKPEGLAQFPVLIQRSCYPNQQPLYEINGAELTRRGYGYVIQTCRGILIFQLNDILVDLTVAGLEHGDFPVILRSFRFEFADFRVHSSSLW